MRVRLNHPRSLSDHSTAHTGHFLLFKSPFGELDLVREEITVHVDMNEFELGSQGMQRSARLWIRSIPIHNLHSPFVIGISLKILVTVSTDFEMILVLGHGRFLVVRVETFRSLGMQKTDIVAMFDIFECLGNRTVALLKNPVVVGVLVWVQRDLLL